MCVPSALDPSLAPEGKHVITLGVRSQPYRLDGSDWDAERERVADRIVDELATMIPNLPGSVIARQVLTPLDLERTLALTGGHHLHGDMSPDQLGPLRPVLGIGGYRTPVAGPVPMRRRGPTPAAVSPARTAATARARVLADRRGGTATLSRPRPATAPRASAVTARAACRSPAGRTAGPSPASGEKAMILESAEETGGERVVLDFAVDAGRFVSGGSMSTTTAPSTSRSGRGGSPSSATERSGRWERGRGSTVAPGTWHRWWNAGEGEVRIGVRVEPALRFEDAILVFWGLCADGHTNAEGRPSPLLARSCHVTAAAPHERRYDPAWSAPAMRPCHPGAVTPPARPRSARRPTSGTSP